MNRIRGSWPEVGQKTEMRRVLTQGDFDRFAALSGDDNPIHTDPMFAARTRFGRPVAHGMLLFGLISSVVSAQLPGAVLVEQELMFPTPTYVGEEVTVQVEVTALRAEKAAVELTTSVIRPAGEVGCEGRAVVHRYPPDRWSHTPEVTARPSSPDEATAFKKLRLGQRAALRRILTEDDIQEYVDLTGDANPLYTDIAFAREMGLEGPPLPAALLGGLISCLLGTRLPGQGTNYLKQRFRFPAPACPGQEITAAVEVVRLRPDKELVNLRTTCTSPAGEAVCDGEALVLVRDVKVR